ncbi:hypothetical protein ABZ570_02925 [Micromonospora sp. NPDC007271]|uniref:hypothetical protein n=1 Tax=Micromonospora sp. NPDC007271 TaxID=3154587 RepID=UPI0033D8DA80
MRHEDEDIRSLLTEAVPPLSPPADRLGAVARRVRRHRRRLVGGSALAVVLAVGLAVGGVQGFTGGRADPAPPAATRPAVEEPRCPTHLGQFPDLRSAPYGGSEPLVPEGAVEVTACEVPATGSARAGLSGPRVLTVGVSDVVRVINSLPPYPTSPGSPSPQRSGDDQELRCSFVHRDHELAFVLRYPDRQPVTVYTSANCGVAVSGGRGRGLDFALFTTFFDRYRAQLVARTPPETIPTPTCAPSIPTSRLRLTPDRSGLDDRISTDNPGRSPQLPTRLVAVTACRYEVGDSLARLTGQRSERLDAADALRPTVNAAFDRARTTTCGGYPGYPPPTAFDSLLVADATGATAEFWLRRAPCPALVSGKSSGVRPSAALVAAIDGLLGPPGR